MINALRWLAAAAFDALAHIAYPAADAIWEERRRRPDAELILLDEMADHLGVIRAQLEDIRNLIASAAPSHGALLDDAAEGPPPRSGSVPAGGARLDECPICPGEKVCIACADHVPAK